MVATFHELASSATAVSYYEKDGYYAKNDPEHRKASFWHGGAARDLGLRGHVVPSRFESVLSGHVPKSDIRLGRIVEGEHQHRPGWDITFSAPKSVSLEALVMGDARVIRAHDEAVRATLDWIETDLLQTRGWDPQTGRRPRVKADGMAVAGFRHLTSRDLDPQLHTHCVLANMTRNGEGEWRSIEPTLLRRNEKLIGAHYRNELASRLLACGLAVTPRMVGPVPGFELAGYDQDFLNAFSGRRREILAYLDKHGLPHTREATQKATLHTRRKKVEAGLDELVPRWRRRALDLGLRRDLGSLRPPRPVDPATGKVTAVPRHEGPELAKNEIRRRKRAPALPKLDDTAMADTRERPGPPGAPPELVGEPEQGVLEAVARAVAHFEERRTVIPEREIRALALSHAPGRYRLDGIDRAIERLVADGELRETAIKGTDRAFVTDRAIKSERRILELLRAAEGQVGDLVPAPEVEARMAGTPLTAGQRQAVRRILSSGDGIVGVQGHAGTGKTTMLKEVAGLLGERPVLGLAPSAAATRVLRREAGIGSRTLQWFLVRHGDLSDPERLAHARDEYAGTVLAVDEASMIGTVQMEKLLRIVKTLGIARVVLAGDTAQLKSITAGQPFHLMQKAGMATAVMDEVLRQKDPDLKEAVAHAREGEARVAFSRLENRVTEHRVEELGREAARRWLALGANDRSRCAVLAPTHAIRREINETVREGLSEEGVLHGGTLTIERLVDRRFTRQQASEIGNYEAGDTVVFHRDAYGCRSDDVCQVREIRDGWIVLDLADGRERRFRPSGNAAHNLSVCQTATIEIRAGDRIRWTRNRKERPARYGHAPVPMLVNGEEAQVLEIGRKRVKMMNGEGHEFSLDRNDPQLRHLDHAYSSTVHGAQGRTAPKVIAVLNAGGMADQDMFYVEVSRASEGFSLLTDDREALIERLQTSLKTWDGALEAIGEDLEPPVVDPEEWATLVADWETIERESGGSGTPPSSMPGYGEVMARVAAYAAIEDLPGDLRAFTDRRLEEHERTRAADREVRALIEGLQDHWRHWPELNWAARAQGSAPGKLPAWRTWRDEGTALLDTARQWLDDEAGAGSRLATGSLNRQNLGSSVAQLEHTRLKDDALSFAVDWRALQDRAAAQAVPATLLPGYDGIAALAGRLSGSAELRAGERRAVNEWQALHDREGAVIDAIRTLPERARRLLARRGRELPFDDADGADPDDPRIVEWRNDAGELLREGWSMLAGGAEYAARLDAMAGSRDAVEASIDRITMELRILDRAALVWRVRDLERRADAGNTLPLDMPEWSGLLEDIRTLVDHDGLADAMVKDLAGRLEEDNRWRRDRDRIGTLVGRLRRLRDNRPGQDTPEGTDRRTWRQEARDVCREAEAVKEAVAERERRAHLLTCGIEPAELDRLVGSVPVWQATDLALARVAGWHARVAQVLEAGDGGRSQWEPGDQERAAWRKDAAAFVEEGRGLPQVWEAASVPSGDMADALSGIRAATARIEAALLADERKAFGRLARSVNREVKETGVHFLDASAYRPLLESMKNLREHDGLPDDTRALVAEWQEADGRWNDERRQVARFVEHARTLEKDHKAHTLKAGLAAWLLRPLPDSWRREAQALLAEARRLEASIPEKQRAAHIRFCRDDPSGIARIIEAVPGWLEANDALKEEVRRGNHLLMVGDAMRRIRELHPSTPRTVAWNATEPLVRGDRLQWSDREGMHDMIVEQVGHFANPATIDHLVLRPAAIAGRNNETLSLFRDDVAKMAGNVSCRRFEWPDEMVRKRELERLYAFPDATWSLACDGRVVVGDRIRWTMVRDQLGDTPQVEAVVEGIAGNVRFPGKGQVTLEVIRSWGMESPPEPGTTIRQEMKSLFLRGCVRVPWQDEEKRAGMVLQAEQEARSRGRSQGFSM